MFEPGLAAFLPQPIQRPSEVRLTCYGLMAGAMLTHRRGAIIQHGTSSSRAQLRSVNLRCVTIRPPLDDQRLMGGGFGGRGSPDRGGGGTARKRAWPEKANCRQKVDRMMPQMNSKSRVALIAATVGLSLLATGCATK